MKGFFIFAQTKIMLYLFLNSISTGEVIIIMVFILMFFGSKSIPNMAKTFGRTLRQIRDATDDIKRDIRNSTSEIEKEFKGIKEDITKSSKSVTENFENQTKDLKDISKKFKSTLESAGTETISNKRKPITEKFVSEEELISGEERKEDQADLEKSEITNSENTDDQKPSVSNTDVNENASEENRESKTSVPKKAGKSDKTIPASETEQKTDKDPES